jgi:uncharacterized protein YkwD
MRRPGATDAGKVHRLRSMLGVLALVICLCATGGATALAGLSTSADTAAARAATAHQQTGHRHRRHAHTAVSCAKQSSFHASGRIHRRHRKHHHTSCAKLHSGSHRVDHVRQHRPGAVGPAHAGDSCPGADLQPTQENIETIRAATLCLVDQERADHGEAALQFNANLQQSAQAHTESMAFGDYFEHDGPGGDTPLSRMIASGYIPSSNVGYEIGENIGWGTLDLGTPHAIVAAWMASPGHRANILDARFQDTAIGVSPHVPSSLSGGQSGGIYTQDFGVIITG